MRNISFDKTDYPDAHKQIPVPHEWHSDSLIRDAELNTITKHSRLMPKG